MMTAVNTNDSPHQLPKINSFGYPDCHYQKPGHILNDCLFFLLTFFSLWLFFFLRMAMAFPCASPSNGCSEDGWDERIKNGFPKSPAGGFLRVSAFLGEGNGTGKGRGGTT